MNIDWSKAPEGATHAGNMRGSVHRQCWYKFELGYWFFTYDDKWERLDAIPGHTPLIDRPHAWTGECLPPVGTVCEFRSKSEDCVIWRKAEVMYLTRDTIVLRFDETFAECAGYPDVFLFRPIRTPEQIEIDLRAATIKGMVISCNGLGVERAGVLYDAGYRK